MPLSKLKIFCALHRPVGKMQIGYHLFVILCSFTTGFLLNMFNLKEEYKSKSLKATYCIDLMLIVILLLEMVLQIWSSSCQMCYQGVCGKFTYLYDNLTYKVINSVGIATYIAFLVKSKSTFTPTLSIGHVTQILQIYRLTHNQLRLVTRTIYYKFGFIFSVLLITVALFIFLSRCLYFLEQNKNDKIKNIYDAAWLVFVTIATIGYGDKEPQTVLGKLFIIFLSYFGLVSFSLLISLLGAQLAYEKKQANIISLIPAASLIQNTWILHVMKTDEYWRHINDDWSDLDKKAIIHLQKIKYLVSRRHFKVTKSDIMTFDENLLLYEHLLNRLDFIEKNIYHNSYTLNALNAQLETFERIYNGDD